MRCRYEFGQMEEILLCMLGSKFVHDFNSTLIRISGDLIPETIIIVLSYHLKGHRLIGEVIKTINTPSGVDCVYFCVRDEETCRSVNFKKDTNDEENCELLKTVDSEEPVNSLKKDENFDYYILLEPKRVSY